MKSKKHKQILDDYDIQKSNHLEKLASKTLRDDEKYQKLKGKKLKGKFLDNF
ncbi:hypothetical protein N9034_00005 [bacterium]|nr:hypothetical protein [bacterium]MDB4489544.1 hypothetical protein [bacterium]